MQLLHNLKLTVAATALVGALALASGSAQATLITLDQLFAGATITAGDKLFSNFFEEVNSGSKVVDTTLIDVTPLNDGGLDPGPGLKFTALQDTMSGVGALAVTGGDFIDFRFSFDVTVLAPGLLIKDNSLSFMPDVSGGGSASIDETVFEFFTGPSIGTKSVFADGEFGGVLFDEIDITPPRTTIFVEKDIFVDSFFGDAEILMFTQRFSQVRVPEPGTLALFGLGLVGLGFMRRRKNA